MEPDPDPEALNSVLAAKAESERKAKSYQEQQARMQREQHPADLLSVDTADLPDKLSIDVESVRGGVAAAIGRPVAEEGTAAAVVGLSSAKSALEASRAAGDVRSVELARLAEAFAVGDRVVATKAGSHRGELATVLDPNWSGRVKVTMRNGCDAGATKSCLAAELAKERTGGAEDNAAATTIQARQRGIMGRAIFAEMRAAQARTSTPSPPTTSSIEETLASAGAVAARFCLPTPRLLLHQAEICTRPMAPSPGPAP